MFSDTYKIPGNYYCNSDTKAKTIKNCPFTRAFVLKVTFANGDGYPQQTFINYSTNEMYRRTWDSYKSTWTGEVNYVTNSDLNCKALTTQNLNTIIDTGDYCQAISSQATPELNYPFQQAGLLEVKYFNDIWIYQRYTTYENNTVYKRAKTRDGWGAWKQI